MYNSRQKALDYQRAYYQRNRENRIALQKAINAKKRQYLKSFVDRYKLRYGCRVCGYRSHAIALDFHHINPTQKIRTVASMIRRSSGISSIKDEIRKCVLLCANCHRVQHSYELLAE